MDPETPRRFATAPLIIFPLVGPLAATLVAGALFAPLGLFTLGPGIVLYFLYLAAFWMVLIYLVLAPPFLLTGLLVSLFGRFVRESSFPIALSAAWIVFFLYFGSWYFLSASVTRMRPDAMAMPHWPMWVQLLIGALIVALATAICWRLVVATSSRAAQAAPSKR